MMLTSSFSAKGSSFQGKLESHRPWAQKQKYCSDPETVREGGLPRQGSHKRHYTSGSKSAVDSCGSDLENFRSSPPAVVKSSTSAETAATESVADTRPSDLTMSAESANLSASSIEADAFPQQFVVGSEAETEGSERRGYVETLAMLRHSKAQQEKEKIGIPNPHSKKVVFRPAGQTVQALPKKKPGEFAAEGDVDSDDLTSRSFKPKPEAIDLTGNEFDVIPSQKELEEKYRSKLPSYSSGSMPVFVPADSPSTMDTEGGFKIDRFTETVPPPPYSGPGRNDGVHPSAIEALAAILPHVENQSAPLNGPQSRSLCRRSQADGADGLGIDADDKSDDFFGFLEQNGTDCQLTASNALAAILPCVENQSQLLNGSRSSSRQPLPHHSQACGVKSPQISLNEKLDTKPQTVTVNSSSSAVSGTPVVGSPTLMRSNSKSPANEDHSAAAPSSADAAEGCQKSAYLMRILQQAGRSTASNPPTEMLITAKSSVSAPAVNGYNRALNLVTLKGSTEPACPAKTSPTSDRALVCGVAASKSRSAAQLPDAASTGAASAMAQPHVPSATSGVSALQQGSTEPLCSSKASPPSDSVLVSRVTGSNSSPATQLPAAASTPQVSGGASAVAQPHARTSTSDVSALQSGPGPSGGKSLLAMLGITETPQERTMKLIKAADAKV